MESWTAPRAGRRSPPRTATASGWGWRATSRSPTTPPRYGIRVLPLARVFDQYSLKCLTVVGITCRKCSATPPTRTRWMKRSQEEPKRPESSTVRNTKTRLYHWNAHHAKKVHCLFLCDYWFKFSWTISWKVWQWNMWNMSVQVVTGLPLWNWNARFSCIQNAEQCFWEHWKPCSIILQSFQSFYFKCPGLFNFSSWQEEFPWLILHQTLIWD